MAYLSAKVLRGTNGVKTVAHLVEGAADLPPVDTATAGDLGVETTGPRALYVATRNPSSVGGLLAWASVALLDRVAAFAGLVKTGGGLSLRADTVSALETWASALAAAGTALPDGVIVFATNGRCIGESSGAGTGTLAWRRGGAWRIADGSTLAA